MSDYLFQDEDQEPSQPANLNLAVLLFSAIIYHCGRHQAPAQQPSTSLFIWVVVQEKVDVQRNFYTMHQC